MTPSDFLDAVRSRNGMPSDYAVAKALQLTASQVSKYRHNRIGFSDELCPRIADLAGFDAGFVLASMYEWRAQTAEARAVWHDLARRFAPAGLALLMLWTLLPGADFAHAQSFSADSTVRYVKSCTG